MGLLAPLYFAGLLAIAAPIVFHLIRRTPSGRQVFGSLMFLTPSPPRITKRSRLNNILLLLLRAAALALLAVAFARPFLNSADALASLQPRGRRVAILVDTSASMRRADLWQQAAAQVDQTLATLQPQDEAALYFFDRQVRPGMTFAEWNELVPSLRVPAMKARVTSASPTWAGTRLGDALAAAADLLAEEDGARSAGDPRSADAARQAADAGLSGRQLVLISDLQQGGHADALQGHQWPPGVLLQVRAVGPAKPMTNAGVQYVEQRASEADGGSTATSNAAADAGKLRVRVTNQPGATGEQFTLAWATAAGPATGAAPLKVYVPAGRSQMVRVPWPAGGVEPTSRPAGGAGGPAVVDRLVLAGDDADFDNTLYVVPPRQETVRVLFVGDDAADDVKGLRYYLQGAMADTPRRRVEFVARPAAGLLADDADLVGVRLAVVAAPLSDDTAAALRRFAEAGGDVLWVLRDVGSAQGLIRLTELDKLDVAESAPRDYALLARIDLDHPLFGPFADARFADFTKIHFWKHRRVTLPPPPPPPAAPAAGSAPHRVLATFDDGDPFLVEQPVGRGRVLIVTSGWHPADSQFALSSKFVPLVDGLLGRRDGAGVEAQQSVYDPIALPPTGVGVSAVASQTGVRALRTPDGRTVELANAAATAPEATDRPGIYRLTANGQETPIAVNLPADESRTAPLAVEELERFGAKVGLAATSEELIARERQLRTAELESRQKIWRWVVVAVLAILAAETVLAGVLARRGSRAGAVPA